MATFRDFEQKAKTADAELAIPISKTVINPWDGSADGIGMGGESKIVHIQVPVVTPSASGAFKAAMHPNVDIRNGTPYLKVWNGSTYSNEMIGSSEFWKQNDAISLLSAGGDIVNSAAPLNLGGTTTALTWNTRTDGLSITESQYSTNVRKSNRMVNVQSSLGQKLAVRVIGDAAEGRATSNTGRTNVTTYDLSASGAASASGIGASATSWQDVFHLNRSGLVTTAGAFDTQAFVPAWTIADAINANGTTVIPKGARELKCNFDTSAYFGGSGVVTVYKMRLKVVDSEGNISYSTEKPLTKVTNADYTISGRFNLMGTTYCTDITDVYLQIALTTTTDTLSMVWYGATVNIEFMREDADLMLSRAMLLTGASTVGTSYTVDCALNVVVVPKEEYLMTSTTPERQVLNPAKMYEWIRFLDRAVPCAGTRASFEALAAAMETPVMQKTAEVALNATGAGLGKFTSSFMDKLNKGASKIRDSISRKMEEVVTGAKKFYASDMGQALVTGVSTSLPPEQAALLGMANAIAMSKMKPGYGQEGEVEDGVVPSERPLGGQTSQRQMGGVVA